VKRIAVIGNTGRGEYGHSLDEAFVGAEGARIVALADPDEAGRAAAMRRTGAEKGYADYRELLDAERPDIAVLAPHDLSIHLELVLAAAAHGAHVYIEKPLALTPAIADQMIEACDRAGVLLIVAHPFRGRPQIQQVALPLLRSGRIGEPRYARLYGFGDANGGDQWLIDLYPHLFDVLWQLRGAPLFCQAIITQDGRPATPADKKEGIFGMGTSAGNGLFAHYQFDGLTAEFQSFAGDGRGDGQGLSGAGPYYPFRIDIHGTAGSMSIPGPIYDGPDVYLHPETNPRPVADDRWEVAAHEDLPWLGKWVAAHHRMARSMLDMLDGREPEFELCDGRTARGLIAMAMAARASHVRGCRVAFPLEDPGDPFDTW
jgi:predicted dehydrogenase